MGLAQMLQALGHHLGEAGHVLRLARRHPNGDGHDVDDVAQSVRALLQIRGGGAPFGGAALGHVQLGAEEQDPVARLVENGPDLERVVEAGAVLAVVHDLDGADFAVLDGRAHGGNAFGRRLFALQKPAVAAKDLIRLVPGQVEKCRIDVDDRIVGGVRVGDADRQADMFEHPKNAVAQGADAPVGQRRLVFHQAFIPPERENRLFPSLPKGVNATGGPGAPAAFLCRSRVSPLHPPPARR
ncbi:hypothetical protein JSE7799_01299 [Jannaschia seosinensis]|uniref:Uncharacterized protein n=1 Tax=Jannaschia seosinensis TaxID=313367 RepID=A0A0M7B9G2_9RHOB|nr:hypothetical protein JSE7799_01299 [Jannaschia seosinensis]